MRHPNLLPHFVSLVIEKMFPVSAELNLDASDWCNQHSISLEEAISRITVDDGTLNFNVEFEDEMKYAEARMRECPISMGGIASGELLFRCAEKVQAKNVIETGVALGWSSLSILLSLNKRATGRLISTDIPYLVEPHLHAKNHEYVGFIVPQELRPRWTVIRKRDRSAIPEALRMVKQIDMCHYDSDKSYRGRMYAYPLLWEAIRPGGVFVSDDVSDNQAFRNFCQQIGKTPLIIRLGHKYVGCIFKS